MRELSGEQQTEREWDPDVSAGDAPQARATWLRYIFAALCISGLGLVVAVSVGLTTKAQTTESGLTALPETSSAVVLAPEKKQSITKTGALAVFARPETSATDRPARTADLQVAIVREQAAQRDELLARTAEEVSRASEAASGAARQESLTDADRASRKMGARIAAENLRRAIAARVAAANRRQAAESAPDNHGAASGSDRGNTDSGSGGGSTGGGGSGGSGGGGGGNSTGGVAPVPGAVIGSHFGEYGSWSRYHTGIDFRAGHGTPIRAVRSGVVLYAGNSGNWAGNHVAIKHGDGMTTMSSHMSSMAVRAGQTVQAGQIIGRVGQTGRAFGAHLHFELYPAGVKYGDVYKAINPQPWLRASGVTTH
ncbi:MAG TPA: M23 family metallopeptidase [Propionibacteriaceae bacterium]|nr:M23 family metallopeptidase [Propionibacteriaceae bacterium]